MMFAVEEIVDAVGFSIRAGRWRCRLPPIIFEQVLSVQGQSREISCCCWVLEVQSMPASPQYNIPVKCHRTAVETYISLLNVGIFVKFCTSAPLITA